MLWTHEHSYETTQPENILLQIAAETGLIGLLIFFIFVFLVVKNAKEEHNGFLTGILAVLIINLAGVDINYITSSMLIVFYSGIIISGDERGKSFEIKGWKKPACLAAVLLCFACIAVLQLNRYFSNISLKQGIFYSQSKQWPEAMNSYLNAIDKDRHNLPAGYFLANSYFDSGISAKKALAEYLLIEKLAPNYVLLHYNKARIFNWTGNYKEALNEYNKMLKIDPYFKPALVELAQLYFEREKMYPEAENCLKKGLEAYPGDASLYNNLGNIYFMTNRSAEALEAFKKAVDLKADKDYYYNLGCVYFTLEDTENADLYLEKALETGREDSRIIEMLKRVRKYKVQKEGR
jgi:tetratricopeptide (TPR) repeat protein